MGGEYEKAVNLYKESIEIKKRVVSDEGCEVAKTLSNLAESLCALEIHQEALDVYLLNIYCVFNI